MATSHNEPSHESLAALSSSLGGRHLMNLNFSATVVGKEVMVSPLYNTSQKHTVGVGEVTKGVDAVDDLHWITIAVLGDVAFTGCSAHE